MQRSRWPLGHGTDPQASFKFVIELRKTEEESPLDRGSTYRFYDRIGQKRLYLLDLSGKGAFAEDEAVFQNSLSSPRSCKIKDGRI